MGGVFQVDQAEFIEQARQFQLEGQTIAVVKNNAYNYGLDFAVKAFAISGIDYFATTSIEDAIYIRKICGEKVSIFLLNPTTDFKRVKKYKLEITLPSLDYYQTYKNDLVGLAIHIEFEGLFKRSGLAHIDQLAAILRDAKDSGSTLNIKGLWTHFGYADEFNGIYEKERQLWLDFVEGVFDLGLKPSVIHAQNSASFVRDGIFKSHSHVRLGIGLYGSKPFKNLDDKDFIQASSVTAPIIQIKHLDKGMSLGYSGAFTAEEDCKIAIVDIGYGDGILRERIKHGCQIGGRTYKIVALMMSHMAVLIDDHVEAHMPVYLYGKNQRIDHFTALGVGANSEQLGALNYNSMRRDIVYDD
ncbi:alanine racemase [Jeotgalicoccus meleagridis]|jgi:alanine racemase|uniref:Alanine racemase 2 n=1 Tax=Jeotgalicoccus meleagridis TaxID=2759181 RepID=A0A6V7RJA8_9STAP|nr:alanine racemase [Jeotgalicoccus meleagridis]CAD2077511.1 Alanine racemase 2 [Jeotgalicoccus meleagridis]